MLPHHRHKTTFITHYVLMTVLLIVVCFMPARAQHWQEADSLRMVLKKSTTAAVRINTLLQLSEFEILKPGELKTDLDSGAAYLNEARRLAGSTPSNEINGHLLLVASYLAREQGQPQQGHTLAAQAVTLLHKGSNKHLLGQAYLSLAQYFDNNDATGLKQELDMLQLAAAAFNTSGSVEREAYTYKLMGELEESPDESLRHLRQSLSLYQSIHYKELQAIYDAIGTDYLAITDFKQALEYQLKALKAAKEAHDTTMQLCEINNHIGITYYKLFDYQNSAGYFRLALQIAERYNDIPTVYLLTQNLCDNEIHLNHAPEVLDMLHQTLQKYPLPSNDTQNDLRFTNYFILAHTALKQYNMAEHYSQHLLDLVAHNSVSKFYLSNAYVSLIKYFDQSKQYARELIYLRKNDTLVRELGIPSNIMVNDQAWFRLDSAQQNYKSALSHYLAYTQLRDSIYTITKNKQIEQLKIEYETREKESQITLLNQKAALQQGNLNKVNLVKNVTIGGILLVLIIAGLLFRQSALRKKTNQLVTRKNEVITQKNELLQNLVTEKEWLLKEVHHRVKNNLHSVICLLEAQAAYLENDALAALENSQHRIYTMSLIHQKLYQSDDVKTIDMATYIPELVQYLRDSFATGGQLHFNMDVAPLQLNAAQAIPLGLIINEALTNSIKYAFPDGRRGEITLSLTEQDGTFTLALADNGVGMPGSTTGSNKNSLGLELMKGLTKEIQGTIYFETNNGVKIIVRFQQDALHQLEDLQDHYLASA